MVRKFLVLFSVCALGFSFGCGGGSSSENNESSGLSSGVFVDAPVSRLYYKSFDANGSLVYSGFTGNNGSFKYVNGGKIQFFLDKNANIKFGEVNASSFVTPISFVDTIDKGLVLSAVLQLSDSDNNASDGITIDETKVKDVVGNDVSDVIQSLDSLKEKAQIQGSLKEAAENFASQNLFGEYVTDPDPAEVLNGNFDNVTAAKLLFDGVKGGGIIEQIDNGKLSIDFYQFVPESYSINSDKVKVILVGKSLISDEEKNFIAEFNVSKDNQVVDFKDEDGNQLFVLKRIGYPVPATCETLQGTLSKGNFVYNSASSKELIKCENINNNQVDLGVCSYNQPESDESTGISFSEYLTALPDSLGTCTVKLASTEGTEKKIVGLVTGENRFSFIFNDDLGKEGTSPNFFDCVYNSTSNAIECENVYVNVTPNKKIEEFVVEKVIFDDNFTGE